MTYWKTSLENISPQLSFCSMKLSLFHSIFLLIAVVKSTFCHFFPKNCGEIFSNVVFLLVLIGSYPAMMPVSQLDFMLLTDISKVVWAPQKNPKWCHTHHNKCMAQKLILGGCIYDVNFWKQASNFGVGRLILSLHIKFWHSTSKLTFNFTFWTQHGWLPVSTFCFCAL